MPEPGDTTMIVLDDEPLKTTVLESSAVAQLELRWTSPEFEQLVLALPDDGVEVRFCRWSPVSGTDSVEIALAADTSELCSADRLGILITRGGVGKAPMLWFPRAAVIGEMDEHGRLVEDTDASLAATTDVEACPTLRLRLTSDRRVTVFWPVVAFADGGLVGASEILRSDGVAGERVVKSDWFEATSPTDLWRYLIDGSIFDPRDDGHGRFRCQQCALAWWNYLETLHVTQGSELGRILARVTAWTVCFDLGQDGSWRHGFWNEEPEVHARMLWDGVDLLLSEHDVAPDPQLAEAVDRVVRYAVDDLTEELPGAGLWFLHDSAEHTRPLEFDEPVFGRSRTNSLCLNTHVQALCVLARIQHSGWIDADWYEDTLRRGIDALEAVLGLEFGAGPLRLVDRHLPRLLAWKAPHGLVERVLRFVAYRGLTPVYWWMRRRANGLVFPSGYLDRDVGLTMLADEYHVVNLKDLVTLAQYVQESWLTEIIDRGVRFALTLDFERALERSPIWAEWADVVVGLNGYPDMDRREILTRVRSILGGTPLDTFCGDEAAVRGGRRDD